MSRKMFPAQLELESIGRNRKNDPKASLFSFSKSSSKKSSTSANSSGPEPKAERSRSPNPSPGNRMCRLRAQTKSFFEFGSAIGSKRQKDFKADLFNFGALRTSKSLSQSSSSTGVVVSPTKEDSGNNVNKKRRSTRFKVLSIFNSSDESEEENEVANEDRDDLSPGPSKSRKLSSGKNISKVKKTNPVNCSSIEVGEPLQPAKQMERSGRPKKRGRPMKQSTNTDGHKHDVNMNDSNEEEDTPNQLKKRGRPKKQSTNTDTDDPKHDGSVHDSKEEDTPNQLKKKRGRPKKQNGHKHDESINGSNQKEESPTRSRRTRAIVENGSVPPSAGESDNDDISFETVKFVIEQARSDYMKLKNSDMTDNVLIVPKNSTKTVAGFMSPEFTPQNQEYPGIKAVQSNLSDSLGVGYMKIEGNTIRPPEMSTGGRMIFWILEGSIKVKSAGGHYPKRDSSGEVTNYLYGKKLDQGTCIVIPKMTPFTFENWDSADAVLGFCILTETNEDE